MRRAERVSAVLLAATAVAAVLAFLGPPVTIAGVRFGQRGADGADRSPDATPAAAATAATPTSTSTTVSPTTSTTMATTTVSTSTVQAAPARPRTRAPGWVAAENARPGTDAWRIDEPAEIGWVEGYVRSASARPGDAVPLHVDTASPAFHAEVYRMGHYGGAGARLVWTSPPVPGVRQPPPEVDVATGLAQARWSPSLVLPVGEDWPPGAYLVKLVSTAGGASYVPLAVRDDAAHADVLVVQAVTTWQAYNPWGGCSLYACPGLRARTRAVRVSFDRPYDRLYNHGSADFLDHELPLVQLVEELGIDAAYATGLDVDADPSLVSRYRAALSLGHDEYYSRAMRDALVTARDAGVNLAFFGANALYRRIRLEPASDGTGARVMANYRSERDPVAAAGGEPTTEWRQQGAPEASVVGVQYVCAGVAADFVVVNSGHWVWAGSGVRDGQVLPALVGNEADGVAPPWSPAHLDVLGSSPVRCGGGVARAAAGYYSAPSGAGVFATGTIWWVCALDAVYCSTPANVPAVRAATTNVLRAFAAGRAGASHPSTGSAAPR